MVCPQFNQECCYGHQTELQSGNFISCTNRYLPAPHLSSSPFRYPPTYPDTQFGTISPHCLADEENQAPKPGGVPVMHALSFPNYNSFIPTVDNQHIDPTLKFHDYWEDFFSHHTIPLHHVLVHQQMFSPRTVLLNEEDESPYWWLFIT